MKILNKKNEKINFDYSRFKSECGIIGFDLSPNQDSFTKVLSGQNPGDFGFDIN